MEEKVKVLYVDDEENNLLSFKAVFRMKYKVFTAINAHLGLEILDENPDIQVVITDQRMPDITGVEFLKLMIEKHPNPARIMLTGFSNHSDTIDAVNLGKIFSYLSKPWEEKHLGDTIIKAIEKFKEEDIMRKKVEKTDQAERVSDQMEFLLRQKLLS